MPVARTGSRAPQQLTVRRLLPASIAVRRAGTTAVPSSESHPRDAPTSREAPADLSAARSLAQQKLCIVRRPLPAQSRRRRKSALAATCALARLS